MIAVLVLPGQGWGLQLEFIGPCAQTPLWSGQISHPDSSVGQQTIHTLADQKIYYQGNANGLVSAFGTPVGSDALEVIGNQEMRSYGWCYAVDGVTPEVYPDQYPITNATQKITWFFGYAHYLNGQWRSQCEVAAAIKPAFLCQKGPKFK